METPTIYGGPIYVNSNFQEQGVLERPLPELPIGSIEDEPSTSFNSMGSISSPTTQRFDSWCSSQDFSIFSTAVTQCNYIQTILDHILSFKMIIYGDCVRDYVIRRLPSPRSIDILCKSIGKFWDFYRSLNVYFKTSPIENNSQGHNYSFTIEKVKFPRELESPINITLNVTLTNFAEWKNRTCVRLSCDIFYMDWGVPIGIRYVPKEFEHFPHPSEELLQITKRGEFSILDPVCNCNDKHRNYVEDLNVFSRCVDLIKNSGWKLQWSKDYFHIGTPGDFLNLNFPLEEKLKVKQEILDSVFDEYGGCVICKDSYKKTDLLLYTNCHHLFHLCCDNGKGVEDWLTIIPEVGGFYNGCPTCRGNALCSVNSKDLSLVGCVD